MTAFTIKVRNRGAAYEGRNIVVSGSSGYTIRFDTDSEWSSYNVKTARFVVDGKTVGDVLFEGYTCEMPIMPKGYYVYIGLYAGNIRTTSPAKIRLAPSLSQSDPIPAPPEDIYNKILELLNRDPDVSSIVGLVEEAKQAALEAKKAAEAFETDTTLTEEGMAADALAVKNALNELDADVADAFRNLSIPKRLSDLENDIELLTYDDIPTKLSQLESDINHRTVTDVEKILWNKKSDFSGSYADLSDKPEIPSLEGYATEEYVNETVQNLAGADVEEEIGKIKVRLDDLEYVPVAIKSFTSTVTTAEIGSAVDNVTIKWEINKQPALLTLDSAEIPVTDTSAILTACGYRSKKTWKLEAKDNRNAVSTKTVDLNFYNCVYYGVSPVGTVDSTFVNALATKILSDIKARTITVNAGIGQYIWYAVPSRLGACSFNVGGFDGGFTLVVTVNVTNSSGFTEEYDIYRSARDNLGTTTVKIS